MGHETTKTGQIGFKNNEEFTNENILNEAEIHHIFLNKKLRTKERISEIEYSNKEITHEEAY